MKKSLCIAGIVLLIFLIILPPFLRIALPAKDEEKKEEKIVRQTLSCDSNNYLSRTSYENGIVKMIIIKKVNETTQTETDEEIKPPENSNEGVTPETPKDKETEETPKEEEEEETELAKLFKTLKKDSRVITKEVEDGEVITIDFSASEYSGLEVESLNKPINDQLAYYENNGLVCSVIE